MSKKLKRFREEFLQDLSQQTDNFKTDIKQKLELHDLESSKPVKKSFVQLHRKPIIWACSLIIFCLILAITIMVINNNENNIPVYKGMYANKIDSINRLPRRKQLSEFEDNLINEIGISTIDDITCYEKPNTDIIITIKLDNPKEYELVSLTLNNKKYQVSQFLEGSNANQIVIKYKTTNKSGIEEITLNTIKYIDDTTIKNKNVKLQGKKTIRIGVTYQNEPTATLVRDQLDSNEYSVDFNIQDIDSVLDPIAGVYVYLINNNKLVNKQKLMVGYNTVKFSSLDFSTTYSYMIVGIYDMLDGEGKKATVLYSNEFKTIDLNTIDNNQLSSSTIKFTITKIPKFSNRITTIKLLKEGAVVKTITDFTKLEFNELLSDTDYEIVVNYTYDLNDGSGEKQGSTSIGVHTKKAAPTFTINVISIDDKAIKFSYNLSDKDDTKAKTSEIKLLKEGTLVKTITDFTKLEFNELLSDTDYEIVVNYTYDLNDGSGEKQGSTSIGVHTKKQAPKINIGSICSIKDTINLCLIINDPVKTLISLKIEVYDNDNKLVKEINNIKIDDSVEIEINELSKGKYTCYYIYEYDLNDGSGSVIIDRNNGHNKITIEVKG